MGFNLGGGVAGFFTDKVGVRGDLRYFRKLKAGSSSANDLDVFDVDTLSFWRGTVGITFRF
jgi:hypothetical protein